MLASICSAGSVSYKGYLNDNADAALIGSGQWSSPTTAPAPLSGNDGDIANNLALIHLSYTATTSVTFTSHGFAAGGVDPYFSLFAGNDGTATLLGSNYTQAWTTGGDFILTFTLTPGSYIATMGSFANMSSAENYGSGSLGDGFIGLGQPGSLGIYYYELQVSDPTVPGIPEPGSLTLLGLVPLTGMYARKRRKNTGAR